MSSSSSGAAASNPNVCSVCLTDIVRCECPRARRGHSRSPYRAVGAERQHLPHVEETSASEVPSAPRQLSYSGAVGDNVTSEATSALVGTTVSALGNSFARAKAAARRSTLSEPVLRASASTTTVASPSPFRHGHFWCSKCSSRGFRNVPGLMRHITTMHGGEVVDQPTRDLLVAIERVTCVDSRCGGFRRVGARCCNKCSQPTHVRPPQIGDVIPGPLSVLPNIDPLMDTSSSTAEASTPVARDAELALPSDFCDRVRKLPSNTLLHILKSCRMRLLQVTEKCLVNTALNSPSYALAEEGRSKLLLGAVPEGTAAADEVAARLDLWENSEFDSLLRRAEQQLIVISRRRAARGNHLPCVVDDRKQSAPSALQVKAHTEKGRPAFYLT